MKRVLVLIVLMSLAGSAGSQEVDVLTLEAAVLRALGFNPALKVVEEQRREVEAGVREARADAYPQIAFQTNWSRSRNPSLLNSKDFEDLIGNFPEGSFNPQEQELYGIGFDFSQPIFTFGKVGAAIDLAKLVVDVTDAQIAAVRLDAALLTAEAFIEVNAARESLVAVEAQERTRAESLTVVQSRYDLEEATRLELLQAQSSLAAIRPEIDRAHGRVEVAATRLRSILAMNRGEPIDVESPTREFPNVRDADRIVAIARRRRPEFADLDLQRQALEMQKKVTRADGKPQIEMAGTYGRTVRLPDNVTDALFDDWLVSVGLRWEFLDGGRRAGQVAQLDSVSTQLQWQIADLERQVALEVDQAATEYVAARSAWQASEIAAEAAREASRVASSNYMQGVALQLDLLDAQEREIRSEVDRIEARYAAWTRIARLARAAGLYPHDCEDLFQIVDGEGES